MVITIAGGGSTFTAGIVKSIALRREELEVDEIRLFDINKERQDKVAVVVDWVLHKELNTDIKLVVTTDVLEVINTGDAIKVPVGDKTMGRLFNVVGDTIVGLDCLDKEEHWAIHRKPPTFEEQSANVEILETGIKVIDLLTPCL